MAIYQPIKMTPPNPISTGSIRRKKAGSMEGGNPSYAFWEWMMAENFLYLHNIK